MMLTTLYRVQNYTSFPGTKVHTFLRRVAVPCSYVISTTVKFTYLLIYLPLHKSDNETIT